MDADFRLAELSRREAERRSDWLLLLVSLAVIGASFVLSPSPEVVSLWGWPVPRLCLFSILFDRPCLGCGLTRSFVYLGHGDVVEAFSLHRLGPVFYVIVLAQVPLRAMRLWRAAHLPPLEHVLPIDESAEGSSQTGP